MDILFSQVFEDVSLEESCISDKKNSNILVIGSGGCTLFNILSCTTVNQVTNIDVVDSNIYQLYLIELKMALIKFTYDKELYILINNGIFDIHYMNYIFNNLELSDDCRLYWNIHCNKELFYKGINRIGKFEQLFQHLVNTNFDYDSTFDRTNLSSIFGNDAVVHSLNKEFSKHFKEIIDTYQRIYKKPCENYFFHQILFSSYPSLNLPTYLQTNNYIRLHYNLCNNITKIKFHHSTLYSYLKDYSTWNPKYDLIHTSNIIDWMNEESVIKLLKVIKRCTCNDSYITIRQLNSDINITQTIQKTDLFEIKKHKFIDKSHFYKQLLLIQPKNI